HPASGPGSPRSEPRSAPRTPPPVPRRPTPVAARAPRISRPCLSLTSVINQSVQYNRVARRLPRRISSRIDPAGGTRPQEIGTHPERSNRHAGGDQRGPTPARPLAARINVHTQQLGI